MENSVEKPGLSEIIAKKSIPNVYVRKLKACSEKRDQILNSKNETKLLVESENSTQKETSLSGLGIKRRRDGPNVIRVKPNGPDKEENNNSSEPSDSACVNDSQNDTNFSVSNNGVLEQVKPENSTSFKKSVHGEINDRVFEKGESNSSSVNFSSHKPGNKKKWKKRSRDFKENRVGLNSNSNSNSNSNDGFKEEEEVEKNLEVNAARMLCSLFNKSTTNLSLPNPLSGSNGSGRVLRPGRREGFARKRRHFYEVYSRDLNPFCIVNQRIRVYWPLDERWYIGSVRDYDPLTHLHYVKYDDDEEEWLNLHNERFKLLLFPSEIPNIKWQKSNLNFKQNLEEREYDSDDSVGSSVESEPIISFLTRSSYQSKPVPVPSSSNNNNNNSNDNNNNNNEMKYNKSPVKDRKFTFVYSRKRFRNKKENPNFTSLSNFVNKVVPDVGTTLIVPLNGKVTLKLNFPIELLSARVLFGFHLYWFLHSLFLHLNGGLVSIWRVIKLEIIVGDDSFVSNYFMFEINIRKAVSLFCLLVRIFKKGKFEFKGGKPVSWVKYSISGFNKGGVNLVLFGFLGICEKKWVYLQKRFRSEYSCLKMVEISKDDCLLQKGLSNKFFNQHLSYNPIFSGINPMIYFIKNNINIPKFSQNISIGDSIYDNSSPILFPFLKNVDQISHLIALPAPVQSTNYLIHVSTPTAPRTTLNRARKSSLSKLTKAFKKTRTDNSLSLQPPKTLSLNKLTKMNTNTTNEPSTTCIANLLITSENKGWRESGAHVTINSVDRHKWGLSVQIKGETKYTHYPNQVLQPGSTNRFTHSMMWRAGSTWSLEFSDRNQWFVFKQMYDKCYNKNMRASSVRNIPTPGVRMVEDVNTSNFGVPFVRGAKYVRFEGDEVNRALNVSRVLYDMDSEDEEWVNGFEGLSEEEFERIIDRCEKISYIDECEEFSDEQIELLVGKSSGTLEVVREVYKYWRAKRREKGMPLVRQLQPPLWKHYEKLLEVWGSSRGRRIADKPAPFAFCLKPRGLHVTNKGMKLRSHKRLPASSRTGWKSHDASSAPRRKKLKVVHQSREYPTNTNISFPAFDNTKRVAPSLANRQTRITIKQSRHPIADVANPVRDDFVFLKEDKEEFKLRDASNSAQHLANVARLKREKALLLMHKADLALHRARVSLMIADALKSSQQGNNNNNDSNNNNNNDNSNNNNNNGDGG